MKILITEDTKMVIAWIIIIAANICMYAGLFFLIMSARHGWPTWGG